MKKVLIFYTAIGQGHKSMAQNIAQHLTESGYNVRTEDILHVQKGKLSEFSTWLYLKIGFLAPWLWAWIYEADWLTQPFARFRLGVASKHTGEALKLINEFQPDIIIGAQTTGSAVTAYLKQTGQYKGLFGITFSDFHLHRFWLYDQADFYLCNIDEQKDQMVKLGIPAEKIFVCGMTLPHPPEFNEQEVRGKLNIAPDAKIVLMSGGSLGFGLSLKFIQVLIKKLTHEFDKPFHLIVVTGKNKQFYNELTAALHDPRVTITGFYSPLIELYSVADIFVGKPGGLSTTEALHYRLPMVITSWMGQEQMNIDYLLHHKLIVPVTRALTKNFDAMADMVLHELQSGAFKKSLTDERSKDINQLVNIDPALLRGVFEKAASLPAGTAKSQPAVLPQTKSAEL